MPIFEYKCKDCSEISELLIFNEKKEKPLCKKCGSENLEKLFSSFSSQVKNSSPCSSGACPSSEAAGGHCHGPSCGCSMM